MPRAKIANYTFYKIICNDNSIKNCYIGTTTDFTERQRQHKNNTINNFNLKLYETIKVNGGWENWTMIIIDIQCNLSFKQATEIEQNYINELQADLNMQTNNDVDRNSYAYIRATEWNKKNKEARKLIQLRYRAKKLGLPFLENNEDIPKVVNAKLEGNKELEVNKEEFEYYLKHKKEFEEYKEYLQNKNLFNEFILLKNKNLIKK